MPSFLNRTVLFVTVALVAMLLVGCEKWASLVPAHDTPAADYVEGGGVQIAEGESIRVLQYETHSGFETQGFQCSGDSDSLTPSDPSVIEVHYDGRNRSVSVNGYDTVAMVYVITGLRAGEVILNGSCSDLPTSMAVRVAPRP